MKGFEKKSSLLPFIEDKFIDVDNLWRSTKTSFHNIGDFKLESRIVTFLRINQEQTIHLLGIIKWLGKINSIDCAGINLDEPYKYGNSGKLDNYNKFETDKKHGVFTPITNIKIVTNYIEAPIPSDSLASNDIEIHSAVKLYRINPANHIEKLYGTVHWHGHNDSKEYFYGIKLNHPVADGTDGLFSCQRLFYCKNNMGLLVPVGMVKKCKIKAVPGNRTGESDNSEKYQSIIKLLLEFDGDVNIQNDENETIFDIGYSINDPGFLHSMFEICNERNEEYAERMDLSLTQSIQAILIDLVEFEKWDLLYGLIRKSQIDETSTRYLLLLCISILRKSDTLDFFDKIIREIKDKDIILDNGETFLTTLMKSDVKNSIIKSVLKRKLFNINKPNMKKETPLILACELLVEDIVKHLVKCSCDIKYNNNRAIEVAVLAKARAVSDMNASKIEAGIKIIDILSEANELKESLLCQICMDKNKDVALNCGHLICSVCMAKLSQCPFCNKYIMNSLKIFL